MKTMADYVNPTVWFCIVEISHPYPSGLLFGTNRTENLHAYFIQFILHACIDYFSSNPVFESIIGACLSLNV